MNQTMANKVARTAFSPAARAAIARIRQNPASQIPQVLLGISKREDTRISRTGGRIVAFQAAMLLAFGVYQGLPGI